MIAKIVFIVPSHERLVAIADAHALHSGYWASGIGDGRMIVAAYPRHHHTRFALLDESDVVVLPGAHDPEPIGDLHEHLAHVEAQPHETMRQVSLRLHERHGPAFHPDT